MESAMELFNNKEKIMTEKSCFFIPVGSQTRLFRPLAGTKKRFFVPRTEAKDEKNFFVPPRSARPKTSQIDFWLSQKKCFGLTIFRAGVAPSKNLTLKKGDTFEFISQNKLLP